MVVKKTEFVGRPPGPDTLAIFVGSFRSASTWAAANGLRLNQWTLVESCTPLTVFHRRMGCPSREAPVTITDTVEAGAVPVRRARKWWRSQEVGPKREANVTSEGMSSCTCTEKK